MNGMCRPEVVSQRNDARGIKCGPGMEGPDQGTAKALSPLRAGTEGPDQGTAKALSPLRARRDRVRGLNILIDIY